MNILSKFIDIIYPPRCHICQNFININNSNISYFCHECLDAFNKIEPPLCTICGVPFESLSEENHLCEVCMRKRPEYDALGAPYIYEKGIMEAIHQLKYNSKTFLAESLGRLLASFAADWLENNEDYLIMPVPLHPKRLRERKFNQSLLLSKTLATALDIELDFLSLRRIRYTQPQTGLKKEQRQKNVRRAFDLSGPKELKERTVILVDDVATTGSTLNECAKILKKAGSDRVLGLVLARTYGY